MYKSQWGPGSAFLRFGFLHRTPSLYYLSNPKLTDFEAEFLAKILDMYKVKGVLGFLFLELGQL